MLETNYEQPVARRYMPLETPVFVNDAVSDEMRALACRQARASSADGAPAPPCGGSPAPAWQAYRWRPAVDLRTARFEIEELVMRDDLLSRVYGEADILTAERRSSACTRFGRLSASDGGRRRATFAAARWPARLMRHGHRSDVMRFLSVMEVLCCLRTMKER
jgi:hypothetical protein